MIPCVECRISNLRVGSHFSEFGLAVAEHRGAVAHVSESEVAPLAGLFRLARVA